MAWHGKGRDGNLAWDETIANKMALRLHWYSESLRLTYITRYLTASDNQIEERG